MIGSPWTKLPLGSPRAISSKGWATFVGLTEVEHTLLWASAAIRALPPL